MKFCVPHWEKLRSAIADRGLSHLVAKSGAEAVEAIRLQLDGRVQEAYPDPLMQAHNMITARVAEVGGLYLFTGDYCPVCEFLKYAPPPPEGCPYPTNEIFMIDGPADAVLRDFRQRGLIT